MREPAHAVEVPKSRGRDWIERSLARGHELSAAVLATAPLHSGSFLALVPSGFDPSRLTDFDRGGVMASDVANATLARILDEMARQHISCVVVEDDVGRRTDPAIARRKVPSAFIGDRVISWADLDQPDSGTAAAETIAAVSSGYPRNAFVIAKPAVDLALTTGESLPADFAAKAAASLVAVVVSAFDDESFLVWSNSSP